MKNVNALAVSVLTALAISVPVTACAKGSRGGSHSKSASGSHSVKGHTKKNGTYVPAHRQTNPDGSKRNNYSSKGNINPNTGKEGTKDPNKP